MGWWGRVYQSAAGRTAAAGLLLLVGIVVGLSLRTPTAPQPDLSHAEAAYFGFTQVTNPALNDYPYAVGPNDPFGFPGGQCTSFAAWRVASRDHVDMNAISNFYGRTGLDANNWAARMGAPFGFVVDTNPAVGSVAFRPDSSHGHVAWVSEVRAGGMIVVEDYNELLDQRYHSWLLPASNFAGFIHFESGANNTKTTPAPPAGGDSSTMSVGVAPPSGPLTVTNNPGGSQGGATPPLQGGGSPQGSSPQLQGSNPNIQGSQNGTGGSGGGGSSGQVSLAQGGTAPYGFWYSVSLSGFPAGTAVRLHCFDSVSADFYAATLTTNGSGAASTGQLCYSADGPDHWVTADTGETSNHVSWSGGGSPPPPQQPPPPSTYPETAGGVAHTWTNPQNAGGTAGPSIAGGQTVQMACRLQGFKVADGNTWWYRIAQSPWSNQYYVSADAFYNNGATSGSLSNTPFYDPNVPVC